MSVAETELLSVAEVAELLKVNQQTVRNWIDDGKLAAVRVGARRVRVQRQALEAFIGIELSPDAGRRPSEPIASLIPKRVAQAALAAELDRDAAAAALDQIAAGLSALAAAVRGDGSGGADT